MIIKEIQLQIVTMSTAEA